MQMCQQTNPTRPTLSRLGKFTAVDIPLEWPIARQQVQEASWTSTSLKTSNSPSEVTLHVAYPSLSA